MKVLFMLGLMAVLLVCGVPAALAQQAQESDISAAIAKIDGPDQIQRVLDTQTALQSSDELLRSLALEKALESTDGRVREVALVYLTTVQKQFIVTVEPPQDQGIGSSTPLQTAVAALSPMTLSVNSLDPNTLVLLAAVPSLGSNLAGAITQDGFQVLMTLYPSTGSVNCTLVFRSFAAGALRGALECGAVSFPANTPLP